MEDVLDNFMMEAPRNFSSVQIFQGTYGVLHDIKHWRAVKNIEDMIQGIRQRTSEIRSTNEFDILSRNVSVGEGRSHRPGVSSQYQQQVVLEEDEVMGMEEQRITLIDQLNNYGNGKRLTISIVGPGGSGKTVLAHSVYNDKKVIGQFDFHAWICVSSSITADEFYRCLLSQICVGTADFSAAAVLRNYLHRKRYLIVLDYASSNSEWKYIKNILPDQLNGSRIIITTRDCRVASSCDSDHTHRIRGLPWEQSWKLFCWKAFRNKNGECPMELLDLSQRIVTRCDSLPQAISAVGSLLATKTRTPREWQKVHDSLGFAVQRDCIPSTIDTMLLPSYYGLPKDLKSCLLYFCMLPEDYSIKRARLLRLWVAEGLVAYADQDSNSMEDVAENYLNELIARNLVEATSKNFSGRVRSCRVLNLVRQFILLKSEEEKFAFVRTDQQSMGATRHKNIRRLSIHDGSASVLQEAIEMRLLNVRSFFIFCLHSTLGPPLLRETISRFRLLKILDLEGLPLEICPDCVFDMALLRYLSLRNTQVRSIPRDIKNLRYLEFLDLKQTQVSWLPEEIWSLQYLRHLLVSIHTSSDLLGAEIMGKFEAHVSLRKLSVIQVSRNCEFFSVLGHFTKMEKLGLVNVRAEDGVLLCSCIELMQKLSTLNLRSSTQVEILDLDHMDSSSCPPFIQHLYLKGRLQRLPTWVIHLNSLVRVLLKWSRLGDSPIEVLQSLPNLMELELFDAFTGQVLLFDGGFPKLKTLRFEQLEEVGLISIHKSMQKLVKLSICRCRNLCILPQGIEQLTALEEMLLYEMPDEFTARLGRNSADRHWVDHIPIIHSFRVADDGSWHIQNFS